MLLPSAAGSASAVSVFPESMASGEEPGEDIPPATDHAGVRQQPEVLLCEGLHHITLLEVLLCEGSHHITPLDVLLCEGSHHITPLDVLLCEGSHHITPLDVLLCEGSHHITPLDVLLCEGLHHITPLDVLLCEGLHHITPLDVLLCEGSHHITPLPLTTVSKECISESSAYGEKPGEDTSPATDHAGVRQQPEVLLCEGSQHITPLPLTTVGKECISGVPNPSRPE
ncbi:uncharacterized protein LOC135110158 [Scylla paramamosain]|uniref:uncharacterized protein LOC135110158 n=1 Tax=Scylla paramamosain TaxID=85552 RepID=UPI003083E736